MADKKISQLTTASTPLVGTEVLPIVQGGSTVKVSVANLTAGRAVSADTVTAGTSFTTTNTFATAKLSWSGLTDGVLTFIGTPDGAGFEHAKVIATRDASTYTYGSQLDFYTEGKNSGSTDTSTVKWTLNSLGNLVQRTAGNGIDFSANTHAAGMTSELLNWYEEGTWTPTANNLTVVGDPTYTGRYTRVGRVVYIELRIASTTTTASTAGSTFFSGLPFTPANGSTMTFANANATDSYGTNLLWTDGRVYCPTWAATATVIASGFYFV